MAFDTDTLLERIKRKGSLPEGRFSDDELLDEASQVLIADVVPIIMSIRQEYYVKTTTTSLVAGQSEYDLPSRAVAQALREVKWVNGTQIKDLPHIDFEEITQTRTGDPEYCYIENNKLVIYPTPASATGSLKIYYFRRPNELVIGTSGFRVTAIDTNTGNVTLSDSPTWTTANEVDVISPDDGYDIKEMDKSFSAIATNVLTFTTLPTTLAVGDYICLAGQTVFPQLPAEAQNILVYKTVISLLEEMGDRDNMVIAEARADKLINAYMSVVSNRIQGAPEFISRPLV
jgi:hypothetical protein